MLCVSHISFAYGRNTVFQDLSFDVEPGCAVALTGPNGSGKTTLLKVLAGLSMPSSGSVLFDNFDIWDRPLRYRRQLGYLPETAPLCDGMSVYSYLAYRAKLKGERTLRIRRKVREAAALCALEDRLYAPTESLSLGLKRRVLLADALLTRPRVLLLDDVFSGMDAQTRELIIGIVKDMSERSAIVVSGHETAELQKCCSRIIELLPA